MHVGTWRTHTLSAQKLMARLSSRPEKMNSSDAPATVDGCVSHTLSSKSTIDEAAQPSSFASTASSSGWCASLLSSLLCLSLLHSPAHSFFASVSQRWPLIVGLDGDMF